MAWLTAALPPRRVRLVFLKRHAKGNWTFLMVPRNGLGWSWYPKISLADLISNATKNIQRVISLNLRTLPLRNTRTPPELP
ncbi:MAG: hypothetical protein M3P18_06170, partial [Actinomycetota bacterium]|nr:hypothetical protein [Actinomycetota bacterium]